MRSRLLRAAALSLIAFAAFAFWMHPQTLDPANIGWLLRGSDWGQSTLGLNAYLKAGHWPGTHDPLLMAPEGVPLLMTDSNPLVALLLRPFAPWLPASGIQIIGPWLLACLLLHVTFAYALVRRHAPGFLSAWLGAALLTLLPALFNRYGHATLCAHWLILWALWIFADPRHARSAGWWLAVIGVTGLIHNYLLLMVGAVWASAMLERLVRRDFAIVLVQSAAVAALLAIVALVQGLIGVSYVSTGTYGTYTMALDALIDPANPAYSALIPSSPFGGGRGFEGFQYLGAGLLALLIVAAATIPWQDRTSEASGGIRRLAWLIPAGAVLTILAIGNVIVLHGATILTIPLPARLLDALDPVRSSGRLFWPVAYALVLAAIAAVCRLPRRAAIGVLAFALALQVIDMAPMFRAIRGDSAEAARPALYRRTLDPAWDRWIADASSIEIEPGNGGDLSLLEEIGWRAMLHCRPVRYTYTSRLSGMSQARLAADRARFLAGDLDPTRLYILGRDDIAPSNLVDRMRLADDLAVMPPSRPAPAPALCRANGHARR